MEPSSPSADSAGPSGPVGTPPPPPPEPGVGATGAAGGATKTPKPVTLMTYEPETLKHEISDSQLSSLADGSHSFYFDVFLAAIFACGASAIQGVERLLTLTSAGAKPPTLIDLLIIVLPIVSLILAVIFLVLWRNEKTSSETLVSVIRGRPKKAGR